MTTHSRLVPFIASAAVIAGLLTVGSTGMATAAESGLSAQTSSGISITRTLSSLERSHHTRLGVAAIDVRTGRVISYRSTERFAFASTNKTFIAAAVLSTASAADLDTVVHYTRADLLAYAPITSRFVDTGMTVRELLDAMLRFSDNTAANLLVARLGGPGAVERYLRGLGDSTTRVDRLEPDLNEATPGDPRDTTTPEQFAKDLRGVILQSDLAPTARTLLRNAMLDNTTGNGAIRAGVDPSWPVADKTGTGDRGVRNDIAVIYPLGREPIVIVVMTAPPSAGATADDPLIAAATHAVVTSFKER